MAIIRREELLRWLSGYEKAWREQGSQRLAELFTHDVVYSQSPWAEPARGLDFLSESWERKRDRPGELFSFEHRIVAMENDTAVVRVDVEFKRPERCWRDLWVLRFSQGGRCAEFEEWPFSPQHAGRD